YSETLRPAPTSTLCPYTTLFRSDRLGRELPPVLRTAPARLARRLEREGEGGLARGHPRQRRHDAHGVEPPRLGRAADQGVAVRRDRKSTRLNSSHDQISYAVFCL